jgi:hypothetical protein
MWMAYINRNMQQCVQRELKYIMGMCYAGDGLKNVFQHNMFVILLTAFFLHMMHVSDGKKPFRELLQYADKHLILTAKYLTKMRGS